MSAIVLTPPRADVIFRRPCVMLVGMNAHPRIVLDPAVLAGKPVVRGTRLSVEFVIGLMAEGWSEADILRNHPTLTHEDLVACLAFARDLLKSEKIYPSAA